MQSSGHLISDIPGPSKEAKTLQYSLPKESDSNRLKEVKPGVGLHTVSPLQSLGSQIGSKSFCKCQPQILSGLHVGYLFSQEFPFPAFKE